MSQSPEKIILDTLYNCMYTPRKSIPRLGVKEDTWFDGLDVYVGLLH